MRQQSTGYVILGVLSIGGDLSGYEIRQWIAQSVGFFWSESFGQIYPELRRLAKEDLVKLLDEEEDARGRKRYSITAKGRETLRDWLRRPPQPEKPRVEILLKLFFGRVTGPGAARQFLTAAEERAAGLVKTLAQFEKQILVEDAGTPDLVYALITLSHGQMIWSARRDWAKRALALLEAFEKGGNTAVLRAHKKLESQKG